MRQASSSIQRTVSRTASGFRKPALRAWVQPTEAPNSESPIESQARVRLGSPILRRMVWLYVILLLIEGAFRKWFLPQFSAPLLIIRDPVVILIYLLAHQQRIVPRHPLFGNILFLAVASLFLVVAQFLVLGIPAFVLFYGYRTLFLHLPLIFILPHIFSREDILKLGKFLVLVAMPMAALMAYQFNSAPEAWINKTVGVGGGPQIVSAVGKIRPPGTFSFISGPVAFFSLVTAFVGYGLVTSVRSFPKWQVLPGVISIGLAVAVSGSRAAILSGAIVVGAWIFGTLSGRGLSNKMGQSLIVVVLALFVLGQMESFQEGKEVLSERIELGTESEAKQGGIIGRFLHEVIGPLRMLPDIPLFGAGLGVGTNVGATILTGQMQFLISEGEWGRILLEMGPIFGILFIWLRVAITWDLGKRSLEAAKRGEVLPLLLFSACGVSLFNGQIAQPTVLGFTALGAALCAVSLRDALPQEPVKARYA